MLTIKQLNNIDIQILIHALAVVPSWPQKMISKPPKKDIL
jgi:hypothetical protein